MKRRRDFNDLITVVSSLDEARVERRHLAELLEAGGGGREEEEAKRSV